MTSSDPIRSEDLDPGADLSGVDLSEASLTGADLSEVTLADADLTKATLAGADLARADLYRCPDRGDRLLERRFRGGGSHRRLRG